MESEEWIEWDRRYVWHPFTQVKTEMLPIPVTKAEGINIYTADGKVLKDMNASWWVNIYGHCHPKIVKAIQNQIAEMDQVIFAGLTHAPAAELSKLLVDFTGNNYEKVFFSDDGSTAIEVAIKMAFQYYHNQSSEKKKLIAFRGAYHGDTFGAMSVGERDYFNKPFERHFFEVVYIDLPTDENFHEVVKEFEEVCQSGEIAAFIFEPLIQGSAGMRIYQAAFLDQMMTLCKNHNILTIADEVMTGFGRTGKRLATDYLQNNADIICFSKGITGGSLPLGVTMTTQKIYEVFLHDEKAKGFLHGHSYTGNPVICAAALATLKIWEEENVDQKIVEISYQIEGLAKRMKSLSFISNLRNLGTILAFELKSPQKTSYFHPKRDQLYRFFIEQGYLIRPLGNTIFLMPPYCITEKELEDLYHLFLKLEDFIVAH